MTPDRVAVLGTTGFVVVVMLLSGPLGAGVLSTSADTSQSPPADAGTGSVEVTVTHLPSDGVRFDERDSQVERYELEVPNAKVRVESVSGHPILLYELQIPEIGYGQTGIFFLEAADSGRSMALVMPEDDLPPDFVQQSSYMGMLLVKTRSDAGTTVVTQQNVTVEVVE